MSKIWFKRKTYGWGWTPVTWQGWSLILGYAVAVTLLIITLDQDSTPSEIAFTFILPSVFLTICLIRICYKMGEKPKWQWGNKK